MEVLLSLTIFGVIIVGSIV